MLKLICAVLISMTFLLEEIRAQRPAFAGIRPPGGLSQKDKYHATQNTAVENITGVDIATRFGEASGSQQPAVINLPFGTAQRPPSGVPLVLPISSFVPDQVQPSPSAAGAGVENRFGAPDASAATPVASSPIPAPNPTFSSVNPTSSSSIPAASSSSPTWSNLPIDAHGDREWVNHLSQLPVENQPFWFVNYQAIEAHRNNSRPNVGALETRGSFFRG
ncbi:hypothetical protein KR009_003329 [Drosophila setifemur]|nr:hypothetical protein KR009_003329 [Drosophila setifemur]